MQWKPSQPCRLRSLPVDFWKSRVSGPVPQGVKTKQPFKPVGSKGCTRFRHPLPASANGRYIIGLQHVLSPQTLSRRNAGVILQGRSSDSPRPIRRPSHPHDQNSGHAFSKQSPDCRSDTGLQRRDRSRFTRDSLLRPKSGTLHSFLFQRGATDVNGYLFAADGESALPGTQWPPGGRPA